jgi:hypothetical protein
MTFEELRRLLENEARSRADSIRAVAPEGADGLRVALETSPGRSHTVWVRRRVGPDGESAQCIALAARMPKAESLGAEAATQLLRQNATLAFGAWGLVQLGDAEYVALIRGLPLAFTEPEEVVLCVIELANAADAFEESQGDQDAL